MHAACACEGDGDPSSLVLVLRAAEAVEAGTELSISIRGLDDQNTLPAYRWSLPEAIDEVRSTEHEIALEAPGAYRVHVLAHAATPLAAVRCVQVEGRTRADVLLAALDDRDGDGWDLTGADSSCPDALVQDCDDDDPEAHPDADEVCQDGLDQDCDGQDAPCADRDGDGFPGCLLEDGSCDCDDGNPDVNPGVAEPSDPAANLCDNGMDDDCDGIQARCDRDGDGVVPCDVPGLSCDCDDDDPAAFPGATETPGGACDGHDNNCNSLIDEVEECLADDLDGDGYGAAEDCNDCSAALSPGGTAVCGNRRDDDCSLGGTDDGQPLPAGADECDPDDADTDGVLGAAGGGPDCDDADPEAYPGAPERCGDDVDQDCSGGDVPCDEDADGDGWNADSDCDDRDDGIHPSVKDPCDGRDQDCDGIVDEDIPAGTGCVWSDGASLVDFASDVQHCGSCLHDCNAGCGGSTCRADRCSGGACACGDGPPCEDESTCRAGTCER